MITEYEFYIKVNNILSYLIKPDINIEKKPGIFNNDSLCSREIYTRGYNICLHYIKDIIKYRVETQYNNDQNNPGFNTAVLLFYDYETQYYYKHVFYYFIKNINYIKTAKIIYNNLCILNKVLCIKNDEINNIDFELLYLYYSDVINFGVYNKNNNNLIYKSKLILYNKNNKLIFTHDSYLIKFYYFNNLKKYKLYIYKHTYRSIYIYVNKPPHKICINNKIQLIYLY